MTTNFLVSVNFLLTFLIATEWSAVNMQGINLENSVFSESKIYGNPEIQFCTFQKNNLLNNFRKGKLVYQNSLASKSDVKDWIMEGPGVTEFNDGWMEMYSPDEKFHHVFWCPENFPGSFIAEWELQNLETDAGLCIIFFSVKGNNGENIFDPSFPKRDGTFSQYTKNEDFNNYHISYYANSKDKREREVAHLRKNKGFEVVQVGEPGIPVKSTAIHKMTLIKDDAHILMFVDDRKIIDWTDDGITQPVWQNGKMGFRQMQWTHFRYRNFKVWSLKNE